MNRIGADAGVQHAASGVGLDQRNEMQRLPASYNLLVKCAEANGDPFYERRGFRFLAQRTGQ